MLPESHPEAELRYHVIPSPMGIDWTSPRSLFFTTVKNQIHRRFKRNHPIGHVNIELRYRDPATGERKVFVTGMTSMGQVEQFELILLKGYGMGVLFHDFKGRLESTEEFLEQVPDRREKGQLASLHIGISSKACARLLQFEREYRAKGCGEHYGLPNRPRAAEGSGCSAFGVAFLELAGLMTAEMKQSWSRLLRIPDSHVGGLDTGRKVSVFKLATTIPERWSTAEEPSRELFFYDPDLMYAWMLERFNGSDPAYKRERDGKISILKWDASHVPVPDEGLWLEA